MLISQSGAYVVTFTSNLDGVVFPRASISYGNEMDLTASDFFEYYLDHETDPRVFGVYLEGGYFYRTPLSFSASPSSGDPDRIPVRGFSAGNLDLSGGELRVGFVARM